MKPSFKFGAPNVSSVGKRRAVNVARYLGFRWVKKEWRVISSCLGGLRNQKYTGWKHVSISFRDLVKCHEAKSGCKSMGSKLARECPRTMQRNTFVWPGWITINGKTTDFKQSYALEPTTIVSKCKLAINHIAERSRNIKSNMRSFFPYSYCPSWSSDCLGESPVIV